ncbi:MAG: iron ABC transporter permease, partial [Lentisphaeria bacterium]|nr:iron ABC transporter permease [Lentisphaeria bacterium]NQZ70809.1 iron ABC transporter permease [Lentisphaeria bacterium]
RNMGKSQFYCFTRVAIPLARPAIIGGASLVVMETLNDYGAAKYFGIDTFTTGIFKAYYDLDDPIAALRLSAILLVFILAFFWIERMQRGKSKYSDSKGTRPVARTDLHGYKAVFAIIACMIPVTLGFIIPVFQLLFTGISSTPDIEMGAFFKLIFNSFALAVIAAAIIGLIALYLCWLKHINETATQSLLNRICSLGYGIPGAVIAIGVMMTLLWFDKQIFHKTLIYGTLFALIFAYVVRFMAVGMHPVESGFRRMGKQLTEAARSLGKGKFTSFFRIELPLVKNAIIVSVILVFVDVLKELPLTLILRPFNMETLATMTYGLADEEMLSEASVYALIIILTGLIPIFILNKLLKSGKYLADIRDVT